MSTIEKSRNSNMSVQFRNIGVNGKGNSFWGKGMRMVMGVTGKYYFFINNSLMFKLYKCISFTKK